MKKLKHILCVWLFFAVLQLTFAHEFWLMPERFRLKIGEITNVKLLVGEHFKGEDWQKKSERTQEVLQFFGKQKQDLTAAATASGTNDLAVTFAQAGTHLITMRSKNSFIELEAEKFNEYLKEDGIDNILKLREQKGELGKKAREFYQRNVKTLVQVGDETDETYQKEAGMPLEIIPLQNPYRLKPGDKFSVKIMFEGKPLANHAVRTWHKTTAAESPTTEGVIRTDGKGTATFVLNAKGNWMVSLVRMVPYSDLSQADYQSFWASLTFEI
jgi:uncharacterized GH25 family protein